MRTSSPINGEGLSVIVVGPFPPPPGGMAVQAELLSRKLSEEGVAVRRGRAGRAGGGFITGVPVLRTAVRLIGLVLRLIAFLPKTDAVHLLSASHNSFFLESMPTILLGKLFRKRLIVNYHGGQAEIFLKSWGRVVVPLLRLADVLVVPSDFLKEVFGKFGIRSEVVPNIVDTSAFPFRLRDKLTPRLLNTRHLAPVYDIASSLKAFKIVKEKVPEASLVLAGSGPDEENLRGLSRELGLEDVEFLGGVDPWELPSLYGEGGIYLNSSRFDNMPLTILEAFSSGLPVVTTRAGGIPYIVKDGYNGLLVEEGDYQGLARGVLRLLEDGALARKLAENGRKDCEEKYSWPAVKDRLLKLYSGDE